MRSRLFRIGFGVSLAVFMGAVACLGCALPRFANAENAVVSAESGNLSSPATGSANASEAAHEIVPRASDEVIYTTSQGLAIKKQNATLYMTINGTQYEVIGQGDGTNSSKTVAGYTDLEYVEGTGSQYLDTGLYGSNTLEFELKGRFTAFYSSSNSNMGTYTDGNLSARFCFVAADVSGGYLSFHIGNSNRTSVIRNDTNTHVWKYIDKYYYIDATSKSCSYTVSKGSKTIYIWNYNSTNGLGASCKFILNYCKFWENDSLTRDYIPVKRNSDSVAGLYDLVNNKFYTSASSTAFVAGANKVPEWSTASVYADNSPAAAAISSDAKSGKKSLAGIASVGGAEIGYLVVKNGSNYLKVKI